MIGVVIAAHGFLPDAFLESIRMILGEMEQIATLSLMPGDSLEGLVDRMREAVIQVDTGEGCLILIDLFGGTPSNAAALLTQQMERVSAVTGMNLPMLAEMLLTRPGSGSAEELASLSTSAGQSGIVNLVEAFKRYMENR